MDLAERLEALTSRNDLPIPTTYKISDEEAVERFLDLIASGEFPEEAAKKLGRTARWFRKFRSEKSQSYDEDFAERYAEIMRPDGEHREALVDRARAALAEAAVNGNVRAIEKILMAYDPDFQFLRPAALGGDVNIDKLLVLMSDVPTPILQQVRQALAEQQKALPDVEQEAR